MVGLVAGEVRWRQTSPVRDIRDVARDNTPLRGVCPSGIFRRRSLVMLFVSSGVHVDFSCRNPNLDRPRPSTEDGSEDDVQGPKDDRRRIERLRLPEYGMPGICTADIARCIILLVCDFRIGRTPINNDQIFQLLPSLACNKRSHRQALLMGTVTE